MRDGEAPDDMDRPGPLPAEVAHHTGIALYKLASWGQDRLDSALAPLGLRTRHYAVLAVLQRSGGRSQQAIARKLRIDRTTMVKAIDDLERLGLVERRPDPRDRRAWEVVVTAAGSAAVVDADRELGSIEDRLFAPLGPSDRALLDGLLRRLLGEPPAEPA